MSTAAQFIAAKELSVRNSFFGAFMKPLDWLLRRTDQRPQGRVLRLEGAPKLLLASELEEGDILFGIGSLSGHSSAGTKLRRLIMHFSSGVYVHVAIVLEAMVPTGTLQVYEAVGGGVRVVSLSSFLAEYLYVAVYREPAIQSGSMSQARQFADSLASTNVRYSYFFAAISPFATYFNQLRQYKTRPRESDIAWLFGSRPPRTDFSVGCFCSEFVMEVLTAAGIPGFELNIYNPRRYTPMMLAEAAGLLQFAGFIAISLDVVSPNDPGGWR